MYRYVWTPRTSPPRPGLPGPRAARRAPAALPGAPGPRAAEGEGAPRAPRRRPRAAAAGLTGATAVSDTRAEQRTRARVRTGVRHLSGLPLRQDRAATVADARLSGCRDLRSRGGSSARRTR